MTDEAAEPVIVGAVIAGGHDGAAELVVRLRYPGGAERPVVLDAEAAFRLMRRCGAAHVDELAGTSWRLMMDEERDDV